MEVDSIGMIEQFLYGGGDEEVAEETTDMPEVVDVADVDTVDTPQEIAATEAVETTETGAEE